MNDPLALAHSRAGRRGTFARRGGAFAPSGFPKHGNAADSAETLAKFPERVDLLIAGHPRHDVACEAADDVGI